MKMDEAAIDRSAEEGARCVALALLAEADDAARRLGGGGDGEALHDFRVALRRTRSTLRAFRPWLAGSVDRKMEKRLRRLARASNGARDAEVALPWIAEQRHSLGDRQRAAIDYLSALLEARRAAWAHDQRDVLARYARTSRKLVERLRTYRARIEASKRPTSYGSALASGVADRLAALREDVAAIAGSGDEENVHRARIEGKKLRYLLEPLRGNRHADSQLVVKSLKQLQDVLGDLHDCHQLAAEIAAALIEAAVDRARDLHAAAYERGGSGARLGDELRGGPRAGLLALDRVLAGRREALFATLEAEWRAGGLDALTAEIERLVAKLEARAGGRIENERKFLLSGVPPRAEEVRPIHIAQGWLPGERVRERIRRVSDAGGDRYWRGIKQGSGPQRLASEEEITREVFEALWPVTEGRRIGKLRRKIAEGRLTWEVDQFEDRDLVLAEVELPAEDAEAVIPEWLRPFVVREVTEDPAYHDQNPASQPAPSPEPTSTPPREASAEATGAATLVEDAPAPPPTGP